MLRYECKKVGKVGVPKESCDTLDDVMIIHIKCFIGNDYLLSFKLWMAWKFIVNDLVQFT